MLPLYAQISKNSFAQATSAHTGLLFDKFPDGWNEGQHYQLADHVKKDFLTNCIEKYTETETELTPNLTSALERQRDLVNYLKGESLTVHTDWRFISGLGTAHPYETGFIWHRTLSVPYLSGSSVKGLMRAWAEQWCELPIQQQVTHLFGTEKTKDEQDHSGALIIFDALPTKPPELELDILNPHYSEYYQDSKNPPADYLSPIPVFFLTVAAGHEFEFFLAPRKDVASEKAQQDLKTGLDLLKTALEKLGAGGKTAVGYGAFKESIEAQQRRERTRNENQQRINEEACNAGIEADITAKGYKGLVAKLYRQAQKEHWETDNAKFYQVEQEYLPDISRETDAVIKKAAITLIWEMLEKKFPNIMADPDRMEGRKKDKFAYKNEKARNIAKALRKLNGIK